VTRISTILNLHREGRLCLPTIDSVVRASERAASSGLSCETLVVLDNGDAETLAAIDHFRGRVRPEFCEFGDLAEARNFGVGQARGDYIAFMDGDDLMGVNWLEVAAATASRHAMREVVIHPRENYVFGRDLAPEIWLHPDMDEERIDISFLKVANMWTALSFAKADIYRKFKYRRNDIARGFGFEDWVWNLETVAAGVVHLAPAGTIHFIRRKASGSLLAQSDTRRIIPNFAI
jgi:glycosyltransferase involved in cell wall biosynthesis